MQVQLTANEMLYKYPLVSDSLYNLFIYCQYVHKYLHLEIYQITLNLILSSEEVAKHLSYIPESPVQSMKETNKPQRETLNQ